MYCLYIINYTIFYILLNLAKFYFDIVRNSYNLIFHMFKYFLYLAHLSSSFIAKILRGATIYKFIYKNLNIYSDNAFELPLIKAVLLMRLFSRYFHIYFPLFFIKND